MKEIAVIANIRSYGEYIISSLRVYFPEAAAFRLYSVEELRGMSAIREEFVVLSAYSIYQQVKPKLTDSSRLLVIDRTMRRAAIEELRKLPAGTRALLVNMDYATCIEVINTIYANGLRTLELVPYYPGCGFDQERDGDIRIAITMGERSLVPSFITEILDFGERAISLDSIYMIAEALGVEDPLTTPEARAEAEELIGMAGGDAKLLNEKKHLLSRLSSILRIINKGIIITDNSGKIYMTNEQAAEMLGARSDETEGFNVAEVLPQLRFNARGMLQAGYTEDLIRLDGRDVMVTISDVEENDSIGGKIIMLEYFSKMEARQHQFRRRLSGSGHVARYTFDQIQGASPEILSCKEVAARLARSDSSINILGESGTGKELFAQSIHNASGRRKYSFVAINCSALPENLLESELYGYEEGAFSGASKGGKIGLFELAHRGTLFLDEIGELPMTMQAKLLRAIEEKQILRIGGRDLIDVDVRIISASNRDLRQMVDNGTFREDLYYRLCVLPLYIPPVRERTGDVVFLLQALMDEMGVRLPLTEEAWAALSSYAWPGNVREIRNTVEYLASLGRERIAPEDLPFRQRVRREPVPPASSGSDTLRQPGSPGEDLVKRSFVSAEELELFALRSILSARAEGGRIGRGQLTRAAKEQKLAVSEQDIRRTLTALVGRGEIVSGTGRQGSSLTDAGLRRLSESDAAEQSVQVIEIDE